MHSRLLAVLSVILIGSCAAAPELQELHCEPGSVCTVEGLLVIESLWQASVEEKRGCTALAVPESFYSMKEQFSGSNAQVFGRAFSQPLDEPGTFSYGYTVEEMRVNINNCRMAMIVERIATSDGKTWTRSPK
jgi:hypothetical protein